MAIQFFVVALLALLALQLSLQPFLVKKFVAPSVGKASFVASCEVCKISFAAALLLFSGAWRGAFRDWTFVGSLAAAGAPALVYAAQNVCLQFAFAALSPTTFQLLNQTKVFWSALFAFLLLGRRQTRMQCLSLAVLIFAAIVATYSPKTSEGSFDISLSLGILAGLTAALLSGLASALIQWSLQGRGRNVFLFGGEMAVYTLAPLLIGDVAGRRESFFAGWTPGTLIPAASCAVGGFLVGMVTARAGNVAKGYAIVAGIIMTGFLEGLVGPAGITWRLWTALFLAVGSTVLRLAGQNVSE